MLVNVLKSEGFVRNVTLCHFVCGKRIWMQRNPSGLNYHLDIGASSNQIVNDAKFSIIVSELKNVHIV